MRMLKHTCSSDDGSSLRPRCKESEEAGEWLPGLSALGIVFPVIKYTSLVHI